MCWSYPPRNSTRSKSVLHRVQNICPLTRPQIIQVWCLGHASLPSWPWQDYPWRIDPLFGGRRNVCTTYRCCILSNILSILANCNILSSTIADIVDIADIADIAGNFVVFFNWSSPEIAKWTNQLYIIFARSCELRINVFFPYTCYFSKRYYSRYPRDQQI